MVQNDSRLIRRVAHKLDKDESVILIVKRDPIVILPSLIRLILLSILAGIFGWYFRDVGFGLEFWFNSTGIANKILAIFMAWEWVKFLATEFVDYNHEFLAITKGRFGARAIYQDRYWRNRTMIINLKHIIATPVKQNRALYQSLLKTGDLRLGTADEETGGGDIVFRDCPNVFDVMNLASSLI